MGWDWLRVRSPNSFPWGRLGRTFFRTEENGTKRGELEDFVTEDAQNKYRLDPLKEKTKTRG